MGRLTRQQAKIREAEGNPPSPPTELPRGAPRRRKQAADTTQPIITSETTEDASSSSQQQDHTVPDQTLREGNAGGYVNYAQDAEGAEDTREQKDSLSDADRFLQDFTPDCVLATSGQHSAEEEVVRPEVIHKPTPSPSDADPDADPGRFLRDYSPDDVLATSGQHSAEEDVVRPEVIHTPTPSPSDACPYLEDYTPDEILAIYRRHMPEKEVVRPEVMHTPTPSPSNMAPSNTSAIFAQILNPTQSPPVNGLATKAGPTSLSTGEQATRVQSVSTQTDGLAASVASPIIHTTRQPHSQPIVVRDASAQTDHRLDTFKAMGRYGFNSGIANIPEFCDITLHLAGEREIRITRVSDSTIRAIADMLENERESSYGRNWLTSEEIAEAEAEAKKAAAEAREAEAKKAAAEAREAAAEARLAAARAQVNVSPENKRKRDDEIDRPEARRRRISLSPPPVLKPRQHPARRMNWRRGMGKSLRATQAALPQDTSLLNPGAGPYNANGELLLSRKSHSQNQHEDLIEGDPAGNIAVTNSVPVEIISSSDVQGHTAPSEADLDDGPAPTQIDEPPPQTPQRGSWLPSMFTSALRFVPNIRRRQATSTADAPDQRVAQTEPRRPMPMHSDFGQRLQTSQLAAQKTFRTKENIDSIRKVKAERDKISLEWEKLEEARRIAEEERKTLELEKQDVADAHRAALSSEPTSSKRRRHSPRVIPNPKGVSYGLDPDFFYASDSEDEEDANASRKSRRTSGPDASPSDTRLPNTPNSSKVPATGSYTSPSEQATTYTGSRFADSPPNVFGQSPPGFKLTIAKDDPRFNHSGHFELPDFSSSSEEDSGEEEETASPFADKSRSAQPSATTGNAASTSSLQKPVGASMFPPATPAKKSGVATAEKRWDPEAAKTLERNRELLRAKIAGQSRSVLSPKDIQNSPNKPHVPNQLGSQQAVQPTVPAIFFQPPQADPGAPVAPSETSIESQEDEGGFSILGAARRTSPKSTAQKLVETLATQRDRLTGLQSYEMYQQNMDAEARGLVESTWDARDDAAAAESFQTTYADFVTSQKQDTARPEPSISRTFPRVADDNDDVIDDEDHASLYDDDEDHDDEEHGDDAGDELPDESEQDGRTNRAHTLPTPTALQGFNMDPEVAAYLADRWTAEDEAYAKENFKTGYATQSAF
ncbi:MAG: hypothetical protein L6R36_008131 [Xanthoria steineri]|nr:MAG: hypothetical protein L6R36_008131 [Xanthoria steineri]